MGERKRQKHARDVHGLAGNVEHISASAWCRAQLRLRRVRPDVGRACPHTSAKAVAQDFRRTRNGAPGAGAGAGVRQGATLSTHASPPLLASATPSSVGAARCRALAWRVAEARVLKIFQKNNGSTFFVPA